MSQHSAPNDGLREAKLIQGTNDGADSVADDLSEWLEGIQKEHFEDETVQKSVPEESTYLEASQSTHLFNSLEELHANFEPLFQQADKSSTQSDIRKKRKFHKAFPIAAVICVIVLCMATAQAFGMNIFGKIAHWTSDQFHFEETKSAPATIGQNSLSDNERKPYNSLQEALDKCNVTGQIAPKWVPKRYSLRTAYAMKVCNKTTFYADYMDKNGNALSIVIRGANIKDSVEAEKNAEKIELFKKVGIKHYLLSDKTCEKANWINNSVEGLIYGKVSRRELKQMINSIYEGK